MTSFLLGALAVTMLPSLIALIGAWAGAVDGAEDASGFGDYSLEHDAEAAGDETGAAPQA